MQGLPEGFKSISPTHTPICSKTLHVFQEHRENCPQKLPNHKSFLTVARNFITVFTEAALPSPVFADRRLAESCENDSQKPPRPSTGLGELLDIRFRAKPLTREIQIHFPTQHSHMWQNLAPMGWAGCAGFPFSHLPLFRLPLLRRADASWPALV